MTATTIENDVWVIYPKNLGANWRAARYNLRTECEKREWNYQEKPSSTIKLNSAGRTRQILPGAEVTAIYRRAHRVRVAVIVFGETHVCLHPCQDEAISRNRITRLQNFLEYKGFIELLNHNTDCTPEWVTSFADRFESTYLTVACEDGRDPRCLPLHVFSNRGTHQLSHAEERAAFDREYGSGGNREDMDGRRWQLNPRVFHGHDQLHIIGTPLPRGLHWDVQPRGDSTLIVTTSEVWKVFRYVNIFPDSHVRGNKPHAKRIV